MFLLIRMVLIGAALLSTASAQTGPMEHAQIQELISNFPKFAGKTVTVTGVLSIADGDYYSMPHFVLLDGSGNSIPVTAWVPLEVPPAPPDSVQAGDRAPSIMRDFLGRTLSLTGSFRADDLHTMQLVSESAVETQSEPQGPEIPVIKSGAPAPIQP